MIKATLTDVMGDDLKVIKAAKVSYDNDTSEQPEGWYDVSLPCVHREQPILTEKQKRLIKYLATGMTQSGFDDLVEQVMASDDPHLIKDLLWKFRRTPTHAAPFGHCAMTFIVEAPVFVARQLVKHEYLRMSEVSRRYIKGDPVYYEPDNWHGIAENVKQGSGEELDYHGKSIADMHLRYAMVLADDKYKHLLEIVSPEEARMVLPLCHMTRWHWSGSLDAFANMCNLRLGDDAQLDTRTVAKDVSRQAAQAFPDSWAALVRD